MSKVQTMYALTKRVEILVQVDKIKTYFTQERECVVTADMESLIKRVREIGYLAKALEYPADVMTEYANLIKTLEKAAQGMGLDKNGFEKTAAVVLMLCAFVEGQIFMIVN
jgi:uncharacterized protein (UPF0305 family)